MLKYPRHTFVYLVEMVNLVEMVMRNGMVLAGSFFQKRDTHKVTYRSGNHKTELDLLVVRRQQLCRIKYCKVIAGEYVTTQHKPVVFIVRMQRTRKSRMHGRKTIKCWKCTEGMIDEYKERVKIKYEELDTEVEAVEEEWKKYKYSFVGVAVKKCATEHPGKAEGQRTRSGGLTRRQGRKQKRSETEVNNRVYP